MIQEGKRFGNRNQQDKGSASVLTPRGKLVPRFQTFDKKMARTGPSVHRVRDHDLRNHFPAAGCLAGPPGEPPIPEGACQRWPSAKPPAVGFLEINSGGIPGRMSPILQRVSAALKDSGQFVEHLVLLLPDGVTVPAEASTEPTCPWKARSGSFFRSEGIRRGRGRRGVTSGAGPDPGEVEEQRAAIRASSKVNEHFMSGSQGPGEKQVPRQCDLRSDSAHSCCPRTPTVDNRHNCGSPAKPKPFLSRVPRPPVA